ncbi:hypothetical protein C8R44DRAFT_888058 [Mycena epipterygia]|nr:hypothetical protein C8R44DRAFT_888058 [Mycena epipterygia]
MLALVSFVHLRSPPLQTLTRPSRECTTFNFNIHLRVAANSPQSESELDASHARQDFIAYSRPSQLLPASPNSTVLQDALADKTYSKPDFLSVFWHQYQAGLIPSCKQTYHSSARVQDPQSPLTPSPYEDATSPKSHHSPLSMGQALIIALKSTFQTSGIGECYRTTRTLRLQQSGHAHSTRPDLIRRVHILLPTSPAIGDRSRDGGRYLHAVAN